MIGKNKSISYKFYLIIFVTFFVFLSFNEKVKSYIYFYSSYIKGREVHDYLTLRKNLAYFKEVSSSCVADEKEQIIKLIQSDFLNPEYSLIKFELVDCIKIPIVNDVKGVLIYTANEDEGNVIFLNYIFLSLLRQMETIGS